MKNYLCVCDDCGRVLASSDKSTDTSIEVCSECGSEYLQCAPSRWFIDSYNRGRVKPWTAHFIELNSDE